MYWTLSNGSLCHSMLCDYGKVNDITGVTLHDERTFSCIQNWRTSWDKLNGIQLNSEDENWGQCMFFGGACTVQTRTVPARFHPADHTNWWALRFSQHENRGSGLPGISLFHVWLPACQWNLRVPLLPRGWRLQVPWKRLVAILEITWCHHLEAHHGIQPWRHANSGERMLSKAVHRMLSFNLFYMVYFFSPWEEPQLGAHCWASP